MQNLSFSLKPESLNRRSLANPIKKLVRTALVAILIIVTPGFSSSAQVVKEMNTMLASMKVSSSIAMQQQAKQIESLVYELHPSVIIKNGEISTYAEAPFVCVDIDAPSIGKILEPNTLFSQAEILTIRINDKNDLSMALDLSNLKGFTNLKYINLLFSFDCPADQVRNLIRIDDSRITVFYIVSIPS
jgi:hypothetical protein